MAAAGHDLFLVASNARDLSALADDLSLRFHVMAHGHACDLRTASGDELWRAAFDRFGGAPDSLFLVAGWGSEADVGPLTPDVLDRLLAVNFRSPVSVVNAALPDMLAGRSRLCVAISSVGAVRGRSANMVYGAAKRGLEAYLQAVRHRAAKAGCRIQIYRVGFMATRMLGARATTLPAVPPEKVARRILVNLDRDVGIAYAPAWWAAVALVLALLPWRIYRRLSF